TATFRELDKDLQALGNLALDQAYVKLNRVNELLQDLGTLNADIAGTSATKLGNDPALDEQGRVLKELASIVEFDSMENPDGTVEIRIGGVPAVSGQNVAVLRPEVDESAHSFRIRLQGGKLVEP